MTETMCLRRRAVNWLQPGYIIFNYYVVVFRPSAMTDHRRNGVVYNFGRVCLSFRR